jgi:hypothetical protein
VVREAPHLYKAEGRQGQRAANDHAALASSSDHPPAIALAKNSGMPRHISRGSGNLRRARLDQRRIVFGRVRAVDRLDSGTRFNSALTADCEGGSCRHLLKSYGLLERKKRNRSGYRVGPDF